MADEETPKGLTRKEYKLEKLKAKKELIEAKNTKTDTNVKSLLDFFQDKSGKINIKQKDSLVRHGGIIGMSAVYIVNGIENIFKDVEKKKKKNGEYQRKKGLGMDIATIGAGVASTLLATGGAIAGLITTFRPETLDAVQDMMIALYQATAKAYRTPEFAKMYSYVLVAEKAGGLIAGIWNKGSRAVLGFTYAISKGIEEIGKVIVLTTNEEVKSAFADMVVAQYQGMAKAYRTDQYADFMGYILAVERGAGVVSAMTNSVSRTIQGFASSLESLTESVGKTIVLATNKDAQDAFANMTIAQYEGMAKAYRTDQYANWMAKELVGERVLAKIAQFTNPVTAIVAGASYALETLTESVGKTVALATNPDVQDAFSRMISAQYDGMARAYNSDTYATLITPSLVVGDTLKNLATSVIDIATKGLTDVSSSLETSIDSVTNGIKKGLGNLGDSINSFFRNTFKFGKTNEEKLQDAKINLLVKSYKEPDDKLKEIANEFAINSLKMYTDGFDMNIFTKEEKKGLFQKIGDWFNDKGNDDIIKSQKNFVKNTFDYLANKAKSGEILATNEFYYNNKDAIGRDYNTYLNSKNVNNNLNYVEKHNTDGLLKGILSELKSINENVSQVQFNNVNNIVNYLNGQSSELPSVSALQ